MLDTTVLCHEQIPSRHRTYNRAWLQLCAWEVENLALNLDLKAGCPILEFMPDSINLCVIHNSRSVPRGITHGRWLLARVWWTVLTWYRVLAVGSTRPFACKYACMHDYFVGVPAGSMLAE